MRRQRPAIGNPSSTCCGATSPLAGSFLRSRAGRANTSLTSLNRAGQILFSNRATQIPAPAPVWMPGPLHSISATSCQRSRSMPRQIVGPLPCRRRAVHQLDPYRTLGGRRRPHARRGRYPADRRRTFSLWSFPPKRLPHSAEQRGFRSGSASEKPRLGCARPRSGRRAGRGPWFRAARGRRDAGQQPVCNFPTAAALATATAQFERERAATSRSLPPATRSRILPEFADAMRRSDTVDLHEGSECVPGRMPEKWKDDHEANEERPSPQHDIGRD